MDLLEQLQQSGAFGTGDIVPASVEWNGHTWSFFVLDLPGGKVRKLLKKDDSDAEIIAASIVDANRKPVLTVEQARELKLPLQSRFPLAAMDVFGFGKKAQADAKKD
jgi:hypothetical protein